MCFASCFPARMSSSLRNTPRKSNALLDEWSHGLTRPPADLTTIGKFLDASIEAASLIPIQEIKLRSGGWHRDLSPKICGKASGREEFLAAMKTYLSAMAPLQTAEFEIVGIEETRARQQHSTFRFAMTSSARTQGRARTASGQMADAVVSRSARRMAHFEVGSNRRNRQPRPRADLH